MNMRVLFSLIVLFFSMHASAQTDEYEVYGMAGYLVNGIYSEQGVHNERPYYKQTQGVGFYLYYVGYAEKGWAISDDLDTDVFSLNIYNSSHAMTPPETGWGGLGGIGGRVVPVGPRISFSTLDLLESHENDGSFEETAQVTIVNPGTQYFTGSVGDDFIALGYATVSDLPDGLTPKLIKRDDIELELSFEGQAAASARADSVEISVTFQDAAFENGTAEETYDAVLSMLSLQFRDELWVGAGHEYSTITSAIAAAHSGDIIRVEAGTYTEKDIIIDKNLSIIGAGVGLTIVQAAESPGEANGRVFFVSASNLTDVLLSDMTIQHGHLVGDESYGGGVRANSPITLRNCDVFNNRVGSWPPDVASGGGIYARAGLVLDSCTIRNNRVATGPHWRVGGGGGVHSGAVTIVNSTFKLNRVDLINPSELSDLRVVGAGILVDSVHNSLDVSIFNSTFVQNTLHGENTQGAGIAFYGFYDSDNAVELVNNIVHPNWADGVLDELFLHESVQAQVNVRHSLIRNLPEDNRINPINVIDMSPGTWDFFNDYGGNVWVVTWPEWSPVIGAGLVMDGVPDLDQRGYSRSGNPDIGAFQHGGTPPVYVTYYANGASGSVPVLGHSLSTNKSFIVDDANDLALANHNFIGWNSTQDGSGQSYEPGEAVTTGTEDIHLYAQWLAEYTLTYTAGPGGRIVGEQTQTITGEGASGTEVAAIADTGYSFVDWSDGLTSPARQDTNVSADLSVTANFVINEYTVTFLVNGETFNQQQVEYGSAALDPGIPSVTGYSFVDWDADFSVVTSDLTINAIFAINTYTVTFLDWDGTVLDTQTVNWNASATTPTVPEREGYTFTGWSRSFDVITENLFVTAQYEINTYIVRFLDWDGAELSSQTVNWNTGATAPADPEREGYTFTGWSAAFDVITADLDVMAEYEVNFYTVTVEVVGPGVAVPSPFTVAHGDQVEFLIEAQPQAQLVSASGCGGAVDENDMYRTADIINDCEIILEFEAIPFEFNRRRSLLLILEAIKQAENQ